MNLIVLSQLLEIDNISRDNSICSYSHKCPSLRSHVAGAGYSFYRPCEVSSFTLKTVARYAPNVFNAEF